MKVSIALVRRLVELGLDVKNLDVATRDNAAVHAFTVQKMVSGDLKADEVARLTADEEEKEISGALQKAIADATSGSFAAMTKSIADVTALVGKLVASGTIVQQPSETKARTDIGAAAAMLGSGTGSIGGDGGSTPATPETRVKCVSEMYSKSCSTLTYEMSSNEKVKKHKTGPVMSPAGDGFREMQTQSELDRAVTGSWFKRMVGHAYRKQNMQVPSAFKMTELDNRLTEYAIHNCKFIGPIGHEKEEADNAKAWISGTKLFEDWQRKALLDDATSGGLEAVPIEFDNAIITQAILTGEFLPYINVVTTSRRRIEGASVANVTFSNTAEGTAVTPFNTASFVAAFDTTIFPIVGAMEIGMDFLDDAPVNMSSIVSERYATGFANKIDTLIAEGSGTGEMLGLMNTSGLTSVTAENSTTGPATVSDLEALLFGVAPAYRREAGRANSVFVSNDTTYRRIRGIKVGTSDQRRVYGMDHESYTTHDHPHRISETTANTKCGFFCLNRYRAYRRQGYTVRIETAGKTLTLSNTELIYVRARFGGQLELGAAGARSTNFQS